jgi:hypothetical protein
VGGYTATVTTAKAESKLNDYQSAGYVVINATIANRNDKAQPYSFTSWKLQTPAGQVIDATFDTNDGAHRGRARERDAARVRRQVQDLREAAGPGRVPANPPRRRGRGAAVGHGRRVLDPASAHHDPDDHVLPPARRRPDRELPAGPGASGQPGPDTRDRGRRLRLGPAAMWLGR